MHTSDGHDTRPVTTKFHGIGPLINTSDVHVQFACHCYSYTSDGLSTSDGILVTGGLPVTDKQKTPVTSKGFCISDNHA
jgi:hypothetical protein